MHKFSEVDLKCTNPNITLAQGDFFIWTWGANIEIKGNSFSNVSRNSIETLDNYRDEVVGQVMVIIKNNRVITPTDVYPFPGPTSYPNGIVAGWFLDVTGGEDPARNLKTIVIDNYIEARGELSGGIIALGDGIAIVNNEVVLSGGSQSKAITQLGSSAFNANNTIKGSGAWGLQALPYREILKASSNTFARNDISTSRLRQQTFVPREITMCS